MNVLTSRIVDYHNCLLEDQIEKQMKLDYGHCCASNNKCSIANTAKKSESNATAAMSTEDVGKFLKNFTSPPVPDNNAGMANNLQQINNGKS